MIDWSTARERYVQTEITHQALAKELGCARETVSRKAKEEDWDSQRSHYRHQVITKTRERAASREAEIQTRHLNLARGLMAKAAKKIADSEPQNLREALALIKAATEIERKALSLPVEEEEDSTEEHTHDYSHLTPEERTQLRKLLLKPTP